MPKYRQKSIIVDAVQVTEEFGHNRIAWPQWFKAAWDEKRITPNPLNEKCTVHTREGVLVAQWGDYMIRGVEHDLSVKSPCVFHSSYVAFLDSKETVKAFLETICDEEDCECAQLIVGDKCLRCKANELLGLMEME